jgi:beta-barrel assembly-enhancing protease
MRTSYPTDPIRRRVCSGLGLAAFASLTAFPAVALTEQAQRDRILFETRENEARLAERGYLVGDRALDAYLQSVMERLYPDRSLRVRAIKDLEANAFSVATGNVYVHTGLLLRVRDEAELAAILGHEGAHILGDHAYKSVREAKSMGVLAATVPLLGLLAGMSSMAGYSRDLEREADRVGMERLMKAGYEPGAAAPVFERMAAEVQARKIKQPPYFFADHPKLMERAQNFREFAAGAAAGERRSEDYERATLAVRLRTLELIHERKEGGALIAVLAEPGQTDRYAPQGDFLLGEGYRLRHESGDDDLAIAAYSRSTVEHPDYAGAYGARGRLKARRGDSAGAIDDLEQYLRLDPTAREAGFARQTIDGLRKDTSP